MIGGFDMFTLYTEAALPKLSQTSLFEKMNENGEISNSIKDALNPSSVKEDRVTLDDLKDVTALMRLNGDQSIKKSLKAVEDGSIILLYHKDSKIPGNLPFLLVGDRESGSSKAYIFADKVVTSLTSQRDYTNLMATIEAAYFALLLQMNPTKFISNRVLMQVLCNIYSVMVTLPLEQKVYMKGEYLTKAMLYAIAYFYRIIDGPEHVNVESVPYKKIISDKIQESVVKEIFSQVASMEGSSFMNLIKLIQNINPVRFKDLEAMYMQHFVTSCGVPIIFSLENLSYLFLLLYSALYKTQLTQFNLNKTISALAKKATTLLGGM